MTTAISLHSNTVLLRPRIAELMYLTKSMRDE